MSALRSFTPLAVIAMLAFACGGATPGPSKQGAIPTFGGDTGLSGSINYQVSGGYTETGVLPFVAVGLSVFDAAHGGWVAWFSTDSGDKLIQLTTLTTGQIIHYTTGNVSVLGTSAPGSGHGCTFTLSKNDASGLAGSVACTNAVVAGVDGTVNHAAINASWDAHP